MIQTLRNTTALIVMAIAMTVAEGDSVASPNLFRPHQWRYARGAITLQQRRSPSVMPP
jgi:predicted NAD/FAD-dependent oxidoreductase